MFLSFFLGFLVGVASLLGLGVFLFLGALDWIERQNKKTVDSLEKRQTRDLFVEPTIDLPYQKKVRIDRAYQIEKILSKSCISNILNFREVN